jgi:hypothetical protein
MQRLTADAIAQRGFVYNFLQLSLPFFDFLFGDPTVNSQVKQVANSSFLNALSGAVTSQVIILTQAWLLVGNSFTS